MAWDIRIDADDGGTFSVAERVPASEIKLEETLNGEEYLTFLLPNDKTGAGTYYDMTKDDDHDVRVQYSGTTIWYGRITGATYTQNWIKCICYNKVYELARRTPFTADYSEGEQADTILSAIATALGMSGSTSNTDTHKIDFSYAYCFDAIMYLAAMTNQDVWTGGENSRGSNVTTIYMGTRSNSRGTRTILGLSARTIDRSLKRDKVIAIGSDANGVTITATQGSGSHVMVVRPGSIRDESTSLSGFAQTGLDKFNTDSMGSSVEMPMGEAYNIYPGDLITLDYDYMELPNGSYKVWRITKEDAIATLEIDRITLTIADRLNQLNASSAGITTGGVARESQNVSTNITFAAGQTDHTNKHKAFHWDDGSGGNAKIKWSDGTEATITLGQKINLSPGTKIYFIKNDEDPTTLYLATDYDDLDEANAVAIVRVWVPPLDGDGEEQTTLSVEIWPILADNTIPVIGGGFLSEEAIITPDFRTAWNVGEVDGPVGIRISPEEIAGYSGGTTKEFYLEAATGKAFAGGGTVTLDVNGIKIKGKMLELEDAASGNDAYIWMDDDELMMETGYNLRISAISPSPGEGLLYINSYDDMLITTSVGLLLLSAGGDTITLNPAGDIVFHQDFVDMRPAQDKTVAIGGVDDDERFRIRLPIYDASSPSSPTAAEGELWYRKN